MKKINFVILKPTPLNRMTLRLILSVLAVIAPIILAILIDIGFIGLLPACTLLLCYMIYRITYLDKCSIRINYSDKSVTITKPLKTQTFLIEEVFWSAKKVGARSASYIIKVVVANKTIMRLRDDAWENVKELYFLPHNKGKVEAECIKRNR